MKHDQRVFYQSLRKYWHLIALTIGLLLLSALAEIFSIAMLIPFLQNLTGEGTGVMSQVIGWVDRHLLGGDTSTTERMYLICGLILVAAWARSLFGYLGSVSGVIARQRVAEDFRKRVVDQLQAVALRFYSETRAGELLHSLTSEMGRVGALLATLITVIQQSLLFAAYAAFMVWVSWQLSLVVLVFFGLLALGLTRLVRSVRFHGENVTRTGSRFVSGLSEFIGGIRTVVAFNRQAYERDRLYRAADELADAAIETGKRGLGVQPLSQAVVSTVLIGVVVLAVQFFVLPGKIGMAPLLAFLFAFFRMMPAVQQLNRQRGLWARNRAALSNVADVLRRDDKPYLPDGTKEALSLQEGMEFQHVSFAYEPDEPVLRDINVWIPRGKMTALVGASGAGKSTLADLIPRFYDPTEGHVLYDGTDLRAFKVHTLREKIAVVSQSTYIFNDTVRANITYGNLEASFEEIVAAAKRANALDFIEGMNQGFDTVLGDRGVRLSGGQRQRIAIARALLRDPEILILDEATSDLDSISEKLMQDSLEELMEGRTVIAIAHRLSTVENADQVIVLEVGRVVEQGTYQELLERKGQLWEYHSLQFQLA